MDTVTTLPQSRPLTRTDLEQMPNDGHRYELIDGTLIVSPAPRPRHQFVSGALNQLLVAACPPELIVAYAPLDVALASDTVLQPDLLVARRSDFSDRDLPVPPLLAVEILSPSTRLVDLSLKRARYEQAGCPAYWVVDPDEPSMVAWELHHAAYTEVARATGSETFQARQPFDVTITPSALVSGPQKG